MEKKEKLEKIKIEEELERFKEALKTDIEQINAGDEMNALYIDFDSMLDDGLTDFEREEKKREEYNNFKMLYSR